MTDPIDILKQRLASGEIGEEEFDRLVKRLSATETAKPPPEPTPAPPPAAAPQAAAPAPAAAPPKKNWFARNWQYGLGAVIAIVLFRIFAGGASDGLTTGNISVDGSNEVSFRVSNTKSTSGDILFWIKQDDIEMCVHKTRVNANFTHSIQFYCPNLHNGRFTLVTVWASSDVSKANIADRIQ